MSLSTAFIAGLTGPARRPRLTLTITVLLVGVALLAAMRVRASANIQDLLGNHNPAAAALQQVLENFPSADELLVLATLEAPPADPDAGAAVLRGFAQSVATTIDAQGDRGPVFRGATWAASPQLLDFFKEQVVPAGLLYLSDAEVAQLRQRLTPQAMQDQLRQDEAMISAPGPAADALARALVKDPLRLREFLGARLEKARAGFRTYNAGPEFISADGQSVLIRIAGAKSPSDLDFCRVIVGEADRLVRPLAPPGVRVEFSGAYAVATASERAIRGDLIESVVISVILMQCAFLIGYRSLLSFPLAFLPIAVALVVAFGVYALIDPTLTPLTAAIGAMLIGCGIDYSVYVSSYYETARAMGMAPREAAVYALRHVGLPLLTAACTSIAGFTAVAFSTVRALRDFALLGALGLGFSLLAAVWVLPALLTLTSRLGPLVKPGPRVDFGRVVGSLHRRARTLITFAMLGVFAAGGTLAVKGLPRFETDLNVMHPSPNPPLETERRIAARFGSADTMIVYAQATTGDELLRAVHRAERALADPTVREAAGVSGTFGLSLLLPDPGLQASSRRFDVARVLEDFDAAVDASSFDPAAFADYKGFLRVLLGEVESPGLATLTAYPQVASMVLAREGHASITLVQRSRGIADAVERDRAVETLRAALRDIPGVTLTGMGVVGYDVERAVRRDLPIFIGLAGVAVVVVLLASFRSLRWALLALVPLACGAVWLLAIMAVRGERFNLANTVGLPLLMGVGVDYGIFLTSMAQQSRKAGEGTQGLVQRFGASFHAIVHTGFVTFIGFATLSFTSTPAVQSLGRVIATGVVACVLAAFIVLAPVLLLLASRKRSQPL